MNAVVDFWKNQFRHYDLAIGVLNPNFPAMAQRVAMTVRGCERVLEAAAGTGLVTEWIAEAVGEVVATDQSEDMLSVLSRKLAAKRITNVTTRVADALALPFDDGVFDGAVAANLLHLLPEPEAALLELARVVRPGGLVCVPTFCHGEDFVTHLVSRVLGVVRFPIVTRFSGAKLTALVEGAGYTVVARECFAGPLPVWFVVGRAKG